MNNLLSSNYKFGEVYRCKVGFTDLSGSKDRPAIVISSEYLNKNRDDVIFISITSKTPTNITVEFSISNLESAGLPKTSFVKPIILSVHKFMIFEKIGELSNEDKLKLKDTLKKIIDLD